MSTLRPFAEAKVIGTGEKPSAGMLVALCFEARTKVHIAHLQTTSYAQHIALNEFYDAIVGLADGFAESYQGRFGIIKKMPVTNLLNESSGLSVVGDLRDWIDANRHLCGTESELQNDIDAIVSQCNSTIYKLTNLH